MTEEGIFFLIVGSVGIYLVTRPGGLLGTQGMIRSDQASANGIGPTGTNSSNLTRQIGGAVLGAGCGIVASIYGTPAAGAAVAPVCAKIGSAIAPSVVRGSVFVAKKTAAGAAFVATNVGRGAVAGLNVAGNTLRAASENPLGFAGDAMEKSVGGAGVLVNAGQSLVDRGLSTAMGALPTPLKFTLAPVVYGTKIANKTADVAVDVAKATTGAVATGAKAVGGAVKSAGTAITHLFGF